MSKPFPGEEPTISAKDSTANSGEPRKSVRTRPALLRKQRLLSALPALSESSASQSLVEERPEQDDFRLPSEVDASPTQPLSEDQPAQADSRAQPLLAKLEETSERFNTELMDTRRIAGADDPHNSTPDPVATSDISINSYLLDEVEDADDARGPVREQEGEPEDTDLVGPGPTLPRRAAGLPGHAPARHRLSRARYHIHTTRTRRRQGQERKQRVRRIRASVLFALMSILLSSSMSTSYHYYQSMIPRLQDLLNKHIEQSTRIYDRNGKLLYTLYDPNQGRSIPISYDQIPGVLQDAQIAAEDKTFWTNEGVDVKATIRSAIVDMVARKAETGASTLTQQVIKNLSHDTDISGQRKLNEATLAIALTQTYPKWKILEMYFNIAPYGAQDLGVEAAVEDYFGLTPSCDLHFHCTPATAFLDRDLSHCTRPHDESTCQSNPLLALARATLLAGIPQNPVNFDPMLSPANVTALLQRQDYVLQQMLKAHMQINLGLGSQTRDEGEITPKVIQQVESLSKSIQFVGFQNRLDAPHFVWWVIQSLANMLGNYQQINPNTGISGPGLLLLLTGGFNIRTTIDLNLEEYVESATQRHLNQPEKQKLTGQIQTLSTDSNIHDAATVVLDSHTGEILAMDGSASWTDSDPRVAGELNGALTLSPF